MILLKNWPIKKIKTVKKVAGKKFVTCCRMSLWLGAFLTFFVIARRLENNYLLCSLLRS